MRRAAAGLLVAAALLASGCIRVGVVAGREIPQSRIERIVPGETTRAEILHWFGSPAHYTDGAIFARLADAGEIAAEDLAALPFADLLVFEILEGEGRALITILFNYVQITAERDRLVVFFDENDVVLYYGFTRQRPGSGEVEDNESTPAVGTGPTCVRSHPARRVGSPVLHHRSRLCRQGADG